MSEFAAIGKMISIFFAIAIYACAWGWSADHVKSCNKNAIWELILARLFIGFHIGALIMWFIWSWCN